MSKTDKKPDRLSRFFEDLDECELSSGDDDSDTETNPKSSISEFKTNIDISKQNSNNLAKKESTKSTDANTKTRLPSASQCLNKVVTPDFLKVRAQKELTLEKNLLSEEGDQSVIDFKSNAVPPPNSYDILNDPGFKVVDSEGRKRKTIGSTTSDSIDSLRDEFESNTEWSLRKNFLKKNEDGLPLSRLVCLSRCFVNMVVYGCSYPQAVMTEVHERSGGMVKQIEEEKKSNAKETFKNDFVTASN